jgi:hypothetical protein
MIFKQIRNFGIVASMMLLGACAVGRSVVDLDTGKAVQNPETGTLVRIASVTDNRQFQVSPPSADIPSLSDGNINDPEITGRAYARKRGGFGKAFGDVLLPEGHTVADAVKTSIENGFRQAGYRVVETGDPEFDNATPVNASILKFWTWMHPGFWEVTVYNKSEVKLQGDLPKLRDGLVVSNLESRGLAFVMDADWKNSASNGLKSLSNKIAHDLGN